MGWLKRGGIGCGGLIALAGLFVLSGYALPSHLELATDREVALPPEAVFDLVASSEGVKRWWKPITAKAVEDGYPAMEVVPQGIHKLTFESGGYVMETWQLKKIDPGERLVVWEVDFGPLAVDRTIRVDREGTGSHVYWSETAEVGNPLMRWMAKVSDPTQNFQDAMAGFELSDR
ncbi:MAG: SRPBCC family protein [Alphaproteobacteria bacterium]|nr:SRPBCC family protein [Alphaproteobacteria bacterium]